MFAPTTPYQLGEWHVYPAEGRLSRAQENIRLQPRVMEVLSRLARSPGELVTREQIQSDVWNGRAMSDEPLNRCIAELRAALGDDCAAPEYIETLPRRGYRLLPAVQPLSLRGGRVRKRGVVASLSLVFITALALLYSMQAPAPETQRLLVLPLRSLSSDPAHQLLADGLTEELVNALADRLDMAVMSGATSFAYRDRRHIPGLHEQLRIDFLVEGSVRLVGDQVKINIKTIDADSGESLSSLTYKHPLSILPEILQTIARDVAFNTGRAFAADDGQISLPSDIPGYREFLEAQHLWQSDDEASIRHAIVLLESMIAKSPAYAPAHAHLAAAYYALRSVTEGAVDYSAVIDRHIALALRNEAAQPLARALSAVLVKNGSPITTLATLEDVVRGNPGLLRARMWYVQSLYRAGYLQEALQHMSYVHEHDPLSTQSTGWLADLHLAAGDHVAYAELIRYSEAMEWRAGDTVQFYAALRRRDHERALFHLQRRWSHSSRVTPGELRQIVDGIFQEQARPSAIALVHDLLSRSRPITRFWGFVWLDLLGAHGDALDLILTNPQSRDVRILYSVWSPEHHALRMHERFPELIERFQLDDIWREKGANEFCDRQGERFACH